MMRRILCITLALLLTFGLCGFAAAETVVDVSTRDQLAALIANATPANPVSVRLTNDIHGDGIVVKESCQLTVDFNGFTFNVDGNTVGSTGTETLAWQLLKDSVVTFKNGTMTSSTAKMLVQNYGQLTLDHMEMKLTTPLSKNPYVISNNNGGMTVKGGTSITVPDGYVAFDVYYWPEGGYDTVKVVIEKDAGTISGDIEYGSDGTKPGMVGEKTSLIFEGDTNTKHQGRLKIYEVNKPTIEIKGKMNSDPNYLVSEGFIAVEAEGGGHIILPKDESIGGLIVTKSLDDSVANLQDETFTFRVKADVLPMDNPPTYYIFDAKMKPIEEGQFLPGTAGQMFELKADWSLWIESLPFGTPYSVEEIDSKGCMAVSSGASGKIRLPRTESGYDENNKPVTWTELYTYAHFLNTQQKDEKVVSVPKTGDDTPLAIYSLCGLLALAGVALLLKRKVKA